MNSDTIAAIATAMSPSGIGIIRISGDEAVNIALKEDEKINRKLTKKEYSEIEKYL